MRPASFWAEPNPFSKRERESIAKLMGVNSEPFIEKAESIIARYRAQKMLTPSLSPRVVRDKAKEIAKSAARLATDISNAPAELVCLLDIGFYAKTGWRAASGDWSRSRTHEQLTRALSDLAIAAEHAASKAPVKKGAPIDSQQVALIRDLADAYTQTTGKPAATSSGKHFDRVLGVVLPQAGIHTNHRAKLLARIRKTN